MSVYRILSQTLTDIADAIRSKTGGTEPIPVEDFADEIAAIPSGGGGNVRSETGTFTVAGGFLTTKTIAHSLDTQKIYGYIWVEPENNEIIAPAGYTLLFAHFTTISDPNTLFDGVTLVENYTSSSVKTALYQPQNKALLSRIRSTWTSHDASWTRYLQYVEDCWAEPVSNSEFNIRTNTQNTYIEAGVTYKYKIWSLED